MAILPYYNSVCCIWFDKKYWRLATSGPPEIWQDHQIFRTGGPMSHCPEMLISSPGWSSNMPQKFLQQNVHLLRWYFDAGYLTWMKPFLMSAGVFFIQSIQYYPFVICGLSLAIPLTRCFTADVGVFFAWYLVKFLCAYTGDDFVILLMTWYPTSCSSWLLYSKQPPCLGLT